MATREDKLNELAGLITGGTLAEMNRHYPNHPAPMREATVTIKTGAKYTRVDVGSSGKYMIDAEGNIHGIKGYGVIHRGHWYGTLDTINEYYWGGYVAVKKSERKVVRLAAHNGRPEGYIISELRR